MFTIVMDVWKNGRKVERVEKTFDSAEKMADFWAENKKPEKRKKKN